MLDEATKSALKENVLKRFPELSFEAWSQTYPAAWAILDGGVHRISAGMTQTEKLTHLTHNMYAYCEAHGWVWKSSKGADEWHDLLREEKTGVEYDCHSIGRALAELCALLGYGRGSKGGGKHNVTYPGSSVFHLQKPQHLVVLPLHHLGSWRPLYMFNREKGYSGCGDHHVWSDHQFVVIDDRVYDAMLGVAGITRAQIEDQYVEWWAHEVQDKQAYLSLRWEPDRAGKADIYMSRDGKTFNRTEPARRSQTKENPFGDPVEVQAVKLNPLFGKNLAAVRQQVLTEPPKVAFKEK